MNEGVKCVDCGADMRDFSVIEERCLECWMKHQRATNPPLPRVRESQKGEWWKEVVQPDSTFEEQAAESERWRLGLQEAWRRTKAGIGT